MSRSRSQRSRGRVEAEARQGSGDAQVDHIFSSMGAGAACRSKHLADRQRKNRRGADSGLSDLTGLDVQREASCVRNMDDSHHLLRRSISRDRDWTLAGRFAVLKKITFFEKSACNGE